MVRKDDRQPTASEWSLDDDQVSDIGNEFLYTGRRLDPETGLYQYRNRYYHAQLGRFVNRDPIGYRGGMNLYGYVYTMPTVHTDPAGLYAWCIDLGGDVGGFVMHPSLTGKVCWDDCGNLAVAATVVNASNKPGIGPPGVISSAAGLNLTVSLEGTLTPHSCVSSMSGFFNELHVTYGEGIVVEGGIEATDGNQDIVIQGGVGIGVNAGLPLGAGGFKLQRTYTFMKTCTDNPCPCDHSWYDARQCLGTASAPLYVPDALGSCEKKLLKDLAAWVKASLANGKSNPPANSTPKPIFGTGHNGETIDISDGWNGAIGY